MKTRSPIYSRALLANVTAMMEDAIATEYRAGHPPLDDN
jgi:hypothetical protein